MNEPLFFKQILLGLLADAENNRIEADAKIQNAPRLSALESAALEASAALGRRDGIRACILAWDKLMDAIKQ